MRGGGELFTFSERAEKEDGGGGKRRGVGVNIL